MISISSKSFMFSKICSFLTQDNSCSIYNDRPTVCKKWSCGYFKVQSKWSIWRGSRSWRIGELRFSNLGQWCDHFWQDIYRFTHFVFAALVFVDLILFQSGLAGAHNHGQLRKPLGYAPSPHRHHLLRMKLLPADGSEEPLVAAGGFELAGAAAVANPFG